jgi:hypothetical protein
MSYEEERERVREGGRGWGGQTAILVVFFFGSVTKRIYDIYLFIYMEST